MERNLSGFLIGVVGTAITLSAYSQSIFTSTQCIAIGLLVLMLGLLVKEESILTPSDSIQEGGRYQGDEVGTNELCRTDQQLPIAIKKPEAAEKRLCRRCSIKYSEKVKASSLSQHN
ncbi:hypothetical protein MRB53_034388 [Persea americana]|uniref:Uncharacterized protein n=1 Tax=Persea americana TaxID=3435 RepID=A0ACC2KYK1_PERAE|nr:hypothetical protein MRB53_034388 [Persea americana]